MKLKPFENQTKSNLNKVNETNEVSISLDSEAAISEVLNLSGLSSTESNENSPNEVLKKHLNANEGSLEDVAIQISNILARGDSDAVKLRAAEFIAKIHEVQLELNSVPQTNGVIINIIGSENKSLIQLVMPKG